MKQIVLILTPIKKWNSEGRAFIISNIFNTEQSEVVVFPGLFQSHFLFLSSDSGFLGRGADSGSLAFIMSIGSFDCAACQNIPDSRLRIFHGCWQIQNSNEGLVWKFPYRVYDFDVISHRHIWEWLSCFCIESQKKFCAHNIWKPSYKAKVIFWSMWNNDPKWSQWNFTSNPVFFHY